MRVSASGLLPASGLIVSNHLSYLDVLFYASMMPCIFVSKSEVLSWPLFGVLARCGGTIFIERRRSGAVEDVSRQIAAALAEGVPVVLFPEGTSSDGSSVLPFFPALFEAAIRREMAVYPSAIAYEMEDGREADLCYYADITFGPHLLTALARKGVHARIMFPAGPSYYADRKAAARGARDVVLMHRQELAPNPLRGFGSGERVAQGRAAAGS